MCLSTGVSGPQCEMAPVALHIAINLLFKQLSSACPSDALHIPVSTSALSYFSGSRAAAIVWCFFFFLLIWKVVTHWLEVVHLCSQSSWQISKLTYLSPLEEMKSLYCALLSSLVLNSLVIKLQLSFKVCWFIDLCIWISVEKSLLYQSDLEYKKGKDVE